MAKFKVVKREDRRFLVVRFWSPSEERWVERTTARTRRRDAVLKAQEVIRDYFATLGSETSIPTDWTRFRVEYERAGKRSSTWKSAANKLEALLDPADITDVNPLLLSKFETLCREDGLREASIGCYLKHIRAALGWAENIELIAKAPKVRLPKASRVANHMKGRPLTADEFERMIKAVPEIVGEESRDAYRTALRIMWLCGLRLAESLKLCWDNSSEIHIVNLDGRRPLLCFPAEDHKRREDTLVALTPDAVEYLRKTPREDRYGRVVDVRWQGRPLRKADHIGRVISAIGAEAEVIVDSEGKRDAEGNAAVRYASAQDLRRSFGSRWAMRVMPVVLKELMRHKSIDTTLKYYVGQNAERTANEVWEAFEGAAVRG